MNIKDLALACHWQQGVSPSPPESTRLLRLLGRIRDGGSIAAAARDTGISYRNAWGLLARWETHLGHPLLIPARGLGT
ncbi:MAG: LysR family transcriptional regulator, partial [Rhodocyclaceae bacterium]|nr:LysR family transcriptional regulator [Rhodocyclaceae bacterium]